MRVAVFSDTHGQLVRLQAAQLLLGRVDAAIHLGDFARDGDAIAESLGVVCHTVRGNCDYGSSAPEQRVLELDGVRLLCVHGHRYPDLYRLSLKAEEERCTAALFGHTHIPLLEAHGSTLLVNPGSLSRPRGGSRPGCALLEIEHGDLRVQLFSV